MSPACWDYSMGYYCMGWYLAGCLAYERLIYPVAGLRPLETFFWAPILLFFGGGASVFEAGGASDVFLFSGVRGVMW